MILPGVVGFGTAAQDLAHHEIRGSHCRDACDYAAWRSIRDTDTLRWPQKKTAAGWSSDRQDTRPEGVELCFGSSC